MSEGIKSKILYSVRTKSLNLEMKLRTYNDFYKRACTTINVWLLNRKNK